MKGNKMNAAIQNNFETLLRSVKANQLFVFECTDTKTGEKVPTLATIERHGEEFSLRPLARVFTGDPYQEIAPPLMDSAFLTQKGR